MKIAITGGRDFGTSADEYYFVRNVLDETFKRTDVMINGVAAGVDAIALEWAYEMGVKVEQYPANWERDGKAAGPIRNQRMLQEGKPDIVYAFPGGKGTRDMVTRAKKHNIPVMEFHYARVD